MHREYHRWYSPSLHRDMELLIFGHGGAKVIAFPTSMGRFYEWENRNLVGLAEYINRGWITLCCVDGVDRESWYAWHKHPGERAWRQEQYDRYVHDEVLPLLNNKNWTPFVITTGASFGAYHAVNFALKHPDRVNRVLGMSGLYDISWFADGHHDSTLYFNNPVDFIPNESDWYRLEHLRRMDIILTIGATDRLKPTNDRLSGALWSKGIGNAVRVWDGLAHDWPDWDKMLKLYLKGHD